MLPPVGSISAVPGHGRFGVVVAAQPISDTGDGRQLVALQVKENAGQIKENAGVRSRDSEAVAFGGAAGDVSAEDQRLRSPSSAARLPSELSAAEKADVARLQQRDQQVRQEEKAHAAVAGDLAGPISYSYQRGPDGRQYAVGGSVGIQASIASGDPVEAARKAGRIAAAANAATNPSAQDYAVARQAYALGSTLAHPPTEHRRDEGLSLTL